MSPNMELVLEWGKVILGFIGPLMVVVVTSKMNRSTKEREEKEKREKGEQDRKDAEIRAMLDNLSVKVDRIDKDLNVVRSTVEEMQKTDAGVRSDLAVLNNYHALNAKHIQKLGTTVCRIGEGLRDSNIDGKVTSAIDDLTTFEKNMYSELFTKAPLSTEK